MPFHHQVLKHYFCLTYGLTSCCSREVGSRLGPFLNDIIQLIVQATAVEDNDELREECLQAFESYARQCPQDFAAHVDVVRMIMSVLAH